MVAWIALTRREKPTIGLEENRRQSAEVRLRLDDGVALYMRPPLYACTICKSPNTCDAPMARRHPHLTPKTCARPRASYSAFRADRPDMIPVSSRCGNDYDTSGQPA